MDDTYTWLRHFADSWWLLAMMSFFIGCVLFALRPGARKLHRDIETNSAMECVPVRVHAINDDDKGMLLELPRQYFDQRDR